MIIEITIVTEREIALPSYFTDLLTDLLRQRRIEENGNYEYNHPNGNKTLFGITTRR